MSVANRDLFLRATRFGNSLAGGVSSSAALSLGCSALANSASLHGSSVVMSLAASDMGERGPECRLSWLCSIHYGKLVQESQRHDETGWAYKSPPSRFRRNN